MRGVWRWRGFLQIVVLFIFSVAVAAVIFGFLTFHLFLAGTNYTTLVCPRSPSVSLSLSLAACRVLAVS